MRMLDKTHSKKVIVEVKGGLGNQMFQYAAARTLSLELRADLLIEKRLGFVLDRQYRRKFELDELPTVFSASTLGDSLPFYIDRVKSFYSTRFGHHGVKESSSNYLFERNFRFIDLAQVDSTRKRYWISGYFQDPRYFETQKEIILKELFPPKPTSQRYLELAKLAENYNLIALGIRIFEESSAPEAHAMNKVTKSVLDYRFALEKLLKSVANPLILVFTTKEFDFLKSMDLPSETIFVNSDRGFNQTISKLWLLSNCKHHIFNNSTFYWWGAVLSQTNYNQSEQEIYCSDNFLNPAIRYPHWKKF